MAMNFQLNVCLVVLQITSLNINMLKERRGIIQEERKK